MCYYHNIFLNFHSAQNKKNIVKSLKVFQLNSHASMQINMRPTSLLILILTSSQEYVKKYAKLQGEIFNIVA